MSGVINPSHVEALCSATYLQDYLDCLNDLPDELQRILTQLMEADSKLMEIQQEIALHGEAYRHDSATANDNGGPRALGQIAKLLVQVQQCGDDKIALSSSILELIDARRRQLDMDRENLDPSTSLDSDQVSTKASTGTGLGLGSKREPSAAWPVPALTPVSAATTPLRDSASPAVLAPTGVTPRANDKGIAQVLASTSRKRNHRARDNTVATTVGGAVSTRNEENCSSAAIRTDGREQREREKDKDEDKYKKQLEEHQSLARSTNKAKKKKWKATAKKEAGDRSPVDQPVDPNEPLYCNCHQVSYGEMIGCDNEECDIEWFHFNCVGLTTKPKGKWYCPACRGDKSNVMRKPDGVTPAKSKLS